MASPYRASTYRCRRLEPSAFIGELAAIFQCWRSIALLAGRDTADEISAPGLAKTTLIACRVTIRPKAFEA